MAEKQIEKLDPQAKEALLAQAKDELRKELQEELEATTMDGLLNKLYDIEEKMEDYKEVMAAEPQINKEIPHPTKAAMGRTVVIIDKSKWSKAGRDADNEYQKLEIAHKQLLETDLVATLRSSPWDHFDYLNGSVNGDTWLLYMYNKSPDGKTLRGIMKFKHYNSIIRDSQGNEQSGVYTYRKERDVKTDKFKMVPTVKPVIVDARPAMPGEVAQAKKNAKRDLEKARQSNTRGRREDRV